MQLRLVILIAAAVFLLICLATFLWANRPSAVGQRNTMFVFAWLCAALAAALVIFSLFPAEHANGTFLGVTLSGAGAFVLLVWTAALKASGHARRSDEYEAIIASRDAELTLLKGALEKSVSYRAPQPISSGGIILYRIKADNLKSMRRIGIVTGDIRRVKCADIWVNSENTDMKMARIHEYSISGIIRFEGSRRDTSGRVVDDCIADELTRKVGSRAPVSAGTAISTGAGELAKTNNVRSIIHVASVQGEPGAGFRQVREIGRCVVNSLAEADRLGEKSASARTVLFPLLGTGVGGADIRQSVAALIDAATDYLVSTPSARVETVYFLAHTDSELAACLAVLDESPLLTPSER